MSSGQVVGSGGADLAGRAALAGTSATEALACTSADRACYLASYLAAAGAPARTSFTDLADLVDLAAAGAPACTSSADLAGLAAGTSWADLAGRCSRP